MPSHVGHGSSTPMNEKCVQAAALLFTPLAHFYTTVDKSFCSAAAPLIQKTPSTFPLPILFPHHPSWLDNKLPSPSLSLFSCLFAFRRPFVCVCVCMFGSLLHTDTGHWQMQCIKIWFHLLIGFILKMNQGRVSLGDFLSSLTWIALGSCTK